MTYCIGPLCSALRCLAQAVSPEPIKASSAAKAQAEATLAMFRKGGRLKASHAGGAGSSKHGGEGGPTVERQVVNCLSCGKVYDCRSFTNDIIRFLGERAGSHAMLNL